LEAASSHPQEIILSVADEYGVSRSLMTNIAYSESRFDPSADNGYDRGLFQINRRYHPDVSDECAFDALCSTRWAAQRIKDGYAHEWASANCYLFVKARIKGLPPSSELKPNSTPKIGAVALFDYDGVKHYAEVVSLSADHFRVFESNYTAGLIDYRDVSYADPSLKGFWDKSM